MKYLDAFLDVVDQEIKEVVDNGRFKSRDEVHMYYELIDMIKDIFCIWAYEDGMSSYSEDRYSMTDRPYRESYERRGMNNYSRDDMSYRSGRSRRYSRNDAKGEFVDELTDIMHNTSDEEVRRRIQSLIQHTERM